MAGRRKRRKWPDEEKRSICRQTQVSGVSVSQVARRYEMNANQVFNWLKDERFAPELEPEVKIATGDCDFLPVEISSGEMDGTGPAATGSDYQLSDCLSTPPALAGSPLSARRVDIILSDGRRILLEGANDLSAVLGLIKGLMV